MTQDICLLWKCDYNMESFRVSLLLEKPTDQPLKFKCEQSNMMKLSLCGGNQYCIWVDILVCKTHTATRSEKLLIGAEG